MRFFTPRRAIVFAIIPLLLVLQAQAQGLPMVKASEVGMSQQALQRINEMTARNIEAGKHVGYVTMVARHGKIVHFEAAGTTGLNSKQKMQKDSLFRIFSMTKPVTTVAAMMLYEDGLFQLSDPVSNYIPELKDLVVFAEDGEHTPAPAITIEQLMTHTAGFTYGFTRDHPVDAQYQDVQLLRSGSSDEFIKKLAAIPLRFEPGTRYFYSVATDVLGVLVERLSGQTLAEFFAERIFQPLGMQDTFFEVPENKLPRFVTNHVWDYDAQKISLIPPERRNDYQNVAVYSGGGGLVSTAMDYMIFCEMLRAGGMYNGTRLLSPKTVQWMTMDHLSEQVRKHGADEFPSMHLYPGQSFGLGFGVIIKPGLSQVVSSKGEYSWGGAADTKFWIDPEEDLVAIILTQLMQSPWETRHEMKVATYQALEKLAGD